MLLPDFDEEFAAEAGFDGLLAGHDAFAGGNEDETAAGFDLRDFVGSYVDAAARFRNLLDFVNGGNFAGFGDGNVKDVTRSVVDELEVSEIAGVFERFDNGNFELTGREIDFVLPYHQAVADSR